MRWQSRKMAVVLGLWVLWLATPAWAELEICNDTEARHSVAIGYKQDGDWVSEGWWQLEPTACITPVLGDLEYRFYYVLAQSQGWKFRHNRISFCTAEGLFTVRGDGDCEKRGYTKSYFAKIDTGKGSSKFTQSLSEYSSRDEADTSAEEGALKGVWGIPFKGEANFHDCTPLFRRNQRVCSFVGNGRKFNVTDDGRTDASLFAVMDQMTPGEPVQLEGDWAARFDTTIELVLRRVQSRPANAEDVLLLRLTGRWFSVTDPQDQFTVFGSGRQNSYDGSLTSMEYLSVMSFCGEFDADGPYLYTWDSHGGTGLCYVLREVTDSELVLTYLPRKTELRYRRLK